ncbi:THO complex subunit 4-A [Babesia microti strain RI]|uniref:THO complex subunit 4-A n=1 Tax=Babesia microti (strain RI) TaxID=1133968 RepID=I7J8I6_BABMR|nr:THO complex subunit 4-A [Babesia microti strain RI]CCF72879.1 THO complex subunit 4-A [Babesia microti strain RI]|eukprot:XP_012647488.1 THO complex subunit 4-A [Babesia microti strain RI]
MTMTLSTSDKLSMALDDIPPKNTGNRSERFRPGGGGRRRFTNDRRFQHGMVIKHIIRISNLDHTIRDNDLMELFSSIGPVVKTWIDYDRTDRSLGTGGCIYERESDAKQAMSQFNGRKIEGLPINLEYHRSKYPNTQNRFTRNSRANRFNTKDRLIKKPIKCPW